MSRLRYLDVNDIYDLITRLTDRLFPGTLAFAPRGREGRDLLEAAVAGSRMSYYRTAPVKAAVLLYRLIQYHPFVDGNKRLAITATLTFTVMNRIAVLAADEELEALALSIAEGSRSQQDAEAFFRKRCFRLDWSRERALRWYAGLPLGDREAITAGAGVRPGHIGQFVDALLREGAP